MFNRLIEICWTCGDRGRSDSCGWCCVISIAPVPVERAIAFGVRRSGRARFLRRDISMVERAGP
jgi:hypothetical protein